MIDYDIKSRLGKASKTELARTCIESFQPDLAIRSYEWVVDRLGDISSVIHRELECGYTPKGGIIFTGDRIQVTCDFEDASYNQDREDRTYRIDAIFTGGHKEKRLAMRYTVPVHKKPDPLLFIPVKNQGGYDEQ